MSKLFKLIATTTILASAFAVQVANADDDRSIVEAFYSKLLSGTTSPDLQARMAEVLAPDWQSRGDYGNVAKTREQFLAQLQGTGTVVPNLNWKVEEILQAGNRYVVRGHATATPVKNFLGVEPSSRGFEIMSIDIHTVENHKIVKSYHVEDWLGAIEQLKSK
ncbi:ester cyclase [Undibacterium sp. TJN19]|uniref:ester cyclase n=1 Tax=Undibacterium sp. TJN19 TaxID=3413055 RepID=UPI003BF3FF73